MAASSIVSTGLARHARSIDRPSQSTPRLGVQQPGPFLEQTPTPARAWGAPVEVGMRRKLRRCWLVGIWAEVLSVSMVCFLQ